jgi:hypothetical protein
MQYNGKSIWIDIPQRISPLELQEVRLAPLLISRVVYCALILKPNIFNWVSITLVYILHEQGFIG